jgi:Lon protease-like protein
MKLPREVPVMTLPNATLFPQALLPLYIFERRYRQMLEDSLNSHRMFAVAMQRPNCTRELPSPVAGLGLIRVAVKHKDGTSHLVLQGLARVELTQAVRYKPYRLQKVRGLSTPPCDTVRADALLCKVRELLEERILLGLPFPFPVMSSSQKEAAEQDSTSPFTPKDILKYLDTIAPEQAADLVSCALLPRAEERQTILETVDVESRLQRLIHFLLAEIQSKRNGQSDE